jgi:DNA-binding SARP family transcriptional activator
VAGVGSATVFATLSIDLTTWWRDLGWDVQCVGSREFSPKVLRTWAFWGPVMAAHRDEPNVPFGARAGNDTMNSARTGLAEAVMELRRLTQDPLFEDIERLLGIVGHAPSGSDVSVETLRTLQQHGAVHLRLADELEAAARCCRLIQREIGEHVDALLAGWEGERHLAQADSDAPSPNTRQRGSPDGWLWGVLRRGRAGSRVSRDRPLPVTPEQAPLPPASSAAPLGRYSGPTVPAADIAALALGPLEVRVAGRRVPRWNSLKARAVFQYLLIHQDRPTRRDVLMALQWPDHSHNSARNNLNVALYNLRNTLDGLGQNAQPIIYTDGCYILNPKLTWWIDRNEFLAALDDAQRARRADRPRQAIGAYHKAVQLYRGPLFEDDAACEWYLPEQRHLKELYLQALEDLAEIYFGLGELSDAVRLGQLATSSDSCCESIHRLLMRCYAAQHQQQLVSRQYRCCVLALRDELGVPPADETVQLFRRLTSASPAVLCAK